MALEAAHITQVERLGDASGRVWGFALDFPACGAVAGDLLRVVGWVLDGSEQVGRVVLECEQCEVRILPVDRARPDVVAHFRGVAGEGVGESLVGAAVAERCGFEAMIALVELPAEFEITVAAHLGSGARVVLAVIRGYARGETAGVGGAGRLQPLMVTSLGRTGTTVLMRMLASHPGIVAERVYPYETNAAGYWMHMVRALAVPEVRDDFPEPFDWGNWRQPPLVSVPENYSVALRGFVREGYGALTAEFGRAAVEAFYGRVAAAQGQMAGVYYCEKMLPSGLQNVFYNMYAGCREIVLVRDFRDVMCSVLAFNAKRGSVRFGRERVASDAAYVEDLGVAAARLVENYRRRADRAHLVRYEDLMLRPRQTLRGMLAYLGLAAGEELVEAIRFAGEGPEMAGHRTAASPRESMGRWRRELSAELQGLCRSRFDGMLGELGYGLDEEGGVVLGEAEG